MSAILAIDLGGTRLRAGIADTTDPSAVRPIGDWPAPRDLSGFTEHVAALVAEHRPTRLGCAIPGLARGTTCVWVPNLPYLDDLDLTALNPRLSVGLGHDAQLALLAEAEAGGARGLTDAILLAIGTGIGSAVLAGGRIVRGSSGAACSFGWAAADTADPGDDRLGWLERHASGRVLDAAAQTAGLADGRALIAAAATGESNAIAALQPSMVALGTALAGAVALLDPQTIILTGGVAEATPVLAPLIGAAMKKHLPPHLRAIEIRAGHFGPRAALVGAAIAGRDGTNWGTGRG